MGDYRTLLGYQKAFSLAMKIYHASKDFLLKKSLA
jgi:hypothetical protein